MFRAIRKFTTQRHRRCNIFKLALAGTGVAPAVCRPVTLTVANRAYISNSSSLWTKSAEITTSTAEESLQEGTDELSPSASSSHASTDDSNLTSSGLSSLVESPHPDSETMSSIPQPLSTISIPPQPTTVEEIMASEVYAFPSRLSSRPAFPAHYSHSQPGIQPDIPRPRNEIALPPQPTTLRQAIAASETIANSSVVVNQDQEGHEREEEFREHDTNEPSRSKSRRERKNWKKAALDFRKQLQTDQNRPWSKFEVEVNRFHDTQVRPEQLQGMILKPPSHIYERYFDKKELTEGEHAIRLFYFSVDKAIRKIERTINYGFANPKILWEALQAYKGPPPDYFPYLSQSSGFISLSILGHSLISLVLQGEGYTNQARPGFIRKVTDAMLPLSSPIHLAQIGISKGLDRFVYIYNPHRLTDEEHMEIVATAVKAIIGAAYVDGGSNRIDPARQVMEREIGYSVADSK